MFTNLNLLFTINIKMYTKLNKMFINLNKFHLNLKNVFTKNNAIIFCYYFLKFQIYLKILEKKLKFMMEEDKELRFLF